MDSENRAVSAIGVGERIDKGTKLHQSGAVRHHLFPAITMRSFLSNMGCWGISGPLYSVFTKVGPCFVSGSSFLRTIYHRSRCFSGEDKINF